MRIAYLINQYPKVSHTFIRREILALERSGFEITRIALRGWSDDIADPADEFERERTLYVLREGTFKLIVSFIASLMRQPMMTLRTVGSALHLARTSERPYLVHLIYVAEACWIKNFLRKQGIKHLHAHFGTNTATVAMLVKALGGPPWSFTVHGPEEFDKGSLINLTEKIRACAFVIAISSYGRSQLYRFADHASWEKVHVVHCGLEKEFFDANETSVPDVPRFVCVGRLCEQKGQLLLVDAVRRLKEEGFDCEVILAGDGELRTELETLIDRSDLAKNVRVTGWISSEAVREQILKTRALVLPSFAEGLPIALMEAMALRRPVISTFVAGIPELVCDKKNGWLIPAGDVNALKEAMQACLESPVELLTRMGAAAVRDVAERHDVDIEARKLAALFKSSIGEQSKSAG